LSEILHIISKLSGCNQKQICEKYNLNIVQLRTYAIKLWKQNFDSFEEFIRFYTVDLNLEITDENGVDAIKQFELLQELKQHTTNTNHTEYTTSIHKSKGLEATCVLVVAQTNDELAKWLEKDHKKRTSIQYKKGGKEIKAFEDNYRLGFVAFSRAKMALYIACLQDLTDENIAKLLKLGVEIIPPLKQGIQQPLF
jgi:DNA helicase-2/ATP-dependent DNA helicase PcrA